MSRVILRMKRVSGYGATHEIEIGSNFGGTFARMEEGAKRMEADDTKNQEWEVELRTSTDRHGRTAKITLSDTGKIRTLCMKPRKSAIRTGQNSFLYDYNKPPVDALNQFISR